MKKLIAIPLCLLAAVQVNWKINPVEASAASNNVVVAESSGNVDESAEIGISPCEDALPGSIIDVH